MLGRSVRLFFPEGTAGKLFTSEIMNWTGRVTVFPRSDLASFLARAEAGAAGVYVLLGQDPEDPTGELAYIGESEELGARLRQHNRDDSKEFWETTFAISSKDDHLTKGHIRYLERRLIQIVECSGRVRLGNGVLRSTERITPLPESDCADMEFFIGQLLLLLPVVGFDGVRERVGLPKNPAQEALLQPTPAPAATFTLSASGVQAWAIEVDDEFVVLKGSQVSAKERESWTSYKALRFQLLRAGKIAEQGGQLIFTEDTIFRAPSAAAAVIIGGNTNGRKAWKHAQTGQSYGQWKDEQTLG